MSSDTSTRGGAHLRGARKRFDWTGGAEALAAVIPDRFFHKKLDRIHEALSHGTVEVDLPDGSLRILGGRGAGPRAVVRLKSWQALMRLALGGSIGWYQAWEAGEWSSDDPVPLFDLFMRNAAHLGGTSRAAAGPLRWANRRAHEAQRNSRSGARANILAHYDIGNEFYAQWLDAGMNYSSGLYLRDDASLEEAQEAKIEAVLNRLDLHRNSNLLEIGCGWGALAQRAMDRFGLNYTGITLSIAQKTYAEHRLGGHREADRARITLDDYRDVKGQFDAIASIEMVEAVGQEYWPNYLDAIARLLRTGGKAAIQFISIREELFPAYARDTDFIQHYIFPGGFLISESRFKTLANQRGLEWLDQKSFGQDYARTLQQWRQRFDAAECEGTLPPDLDPSFLNLWRYYFQYCEGGFRGGGIDVSQVTLVKNNLASQKPKKV